MGGCGHGWCAGVHACACMKAGGHTRQQAWLACGLAHVCVCESGQACEVAACHVQSQVGVQGGRHARRIVWLGVCT